MKSPRIVLLVGLLTAGLAGASTYDVTNRVSFDTNYLTGVTGRLQMVPIRLNPDGASIGGLAFDLCLEPAMGVLKFVSVSAPWADFNGGLAATVGHAVAPGGVTNLRVLAVNPLCPGGLAGDHDALDLYFEVVGPTGSVCQLSLSNVVSVTTPASGTTNEPVLVCVTETTSAVFTVTGRMDDMQLLANGAPQPGGINTLELWSSGGAPVSAFDVTLNFPTSLVRIVEVIPATRGLSVTSASGTFDSGAARVVGVAPEASPVPGVAHPVATVLYEVAKPETNAVLALSMDVNGLCVDSFVHPGFLQYAGETNLLEAVHAPAAAIVESAADMRLGDVTPVGLQAQAPMAGAFDATLTFPTSVFRCVDISCDLPDGEVFYDRAQAATGAVRVIGVTASSLADNCRDWLSLATVHLDVRDDAPANAWSSVRLTVDNLHALGPLPMADYLVAPVEAPVSIIAPEAPDVVLMVTNPVTLPWGESVEIPVAAALRGMKPVMTMGRALYDPAQLNFTGIVPSGIGSNGVATVNTNTPGVASFIFASIVPVEEPTGEGEEEEEEGLPELFRLGYEAIGTVYGSGEAGLLLDGAAHGVEIFPNKTEAATGVSLSYAIGESAMDSDGDTMPDWWEYENFGGRTNGVPDEDADNDGMPNGGEYGADTNPWNPTSRLAITAIGLSGETVGLDWQGGVHATQFVESCDALTGTDSVWAAEFVNPPPTTPENHLDMQAASTSRFYRVRAVR
ncbi:MAG: hypothetical protein PHR35_05465 [Kiritimatiellae bacterium]|nr:hypothetical protein [Kiritimatiellia bacterium]